jgi:hypothetical protein
MKLTPTMMSTSGVSELSTALSSSAAADESDNIWRNNDPADIDDDDDDATDHEALDSSCISLDDDELSEESIVFYIFTYE